MMKDITQDDPYADELNEHLSRRTIIRKLLALRGAKGLSQGDIAAKLGCTQSRISKLESGTDADLSLRDFEGYAAALGFNIKIVIVDKNINFVNEIRYHAFSIRRLTDYLARLALADELIATGVAAFFNEAASNLLRMLQDSADKMKRRHERTVPPISIEYFGTEELR
jgi:transcriptional regulator with XRE-family HTH domain